MNFRRRAAINFNPYGIIQQFMSKARNLARHGGRKENVLARRRHGRAQTPHTGDKTHIQHLIDFIEHKHLDRIEHKRLLLDEVFKTARRADENINPAPQLADLAIDRCTANHKTRGKPGARAVNAKALMHLHGKLARRCHHDGARARAPIAGLVIKALQDRQGKSRCLAGAGLRQPEKITPLKKRRQGPRLNGRRRVMMIAREGREQRVGKIEIGKAGLKCHGAGSQYKFRATGREFAHNRPRRTGHRSNRTAAHACFTAGLARANAPR